ncbi:hypothetical protein HR12_41925 [Microbacterium sp. SUBG005]|nr:hypothetical protein HR12_41925 [Microbacterium sp. SUBG005]
MELQNDLGNQIHVRGVSSVDADERKRSRTATLRGDVDMQRVAFLSAIAERSTLGPAVISLAQPNSEGRVERLVARLWVDGSYQLAITPTYLSKMPLKADQRLESAQRFAYRYIPPHQGGLRR